MAHQVRGPGIENAVGEPIWRSVEFCFGDTADFDRYVAGDRTKGRYGRYDNSSWSQVESRMAELEACPACVLFPTGVAAMTALEPAFLGAGGSIAYCRNGDRSDGALYGTVPQQLRTRSVPLDR